MRISHTALSCSKSLFFTNATFHSQWPMIHTASRLPRWKETVSLSSSSTSPSHSATFCRHFSVKPPTGSGSGRKQPNNSDTTKKEQSSTTCTSELTVWQQIQSPPNLITLTRMASTPFLAYWIVSEQYAMAIGGCTLAAISDYLDGYLAKHYGWTTVLGNVFGSTCRQGRY